MLVRIVQLIGLVAFSFLAPITTGQISSTQEIFVPSETQKLIVVQQLGTDIQVIVNDNDRESIVIDHPAGRTGLEYFVVGPYTGNRQLLLQFSHPHREPQIEVTVLDVALGSQLAEAAQLLTDAGIAAAEPDTASFQKALSYYSRVAEQEIAEFGLSEYARLMQSRLLLDNTELYDSLSLLQRIEGSFLGEFRYILEWMRADIANGQDNYQLAREIYEPLVARLMDSPQHFVPIIELDLAEMKSALGFAQILTGDPEIGLSTLQSALSIAERHRDMNLIGELHNNLAGFYSFSSNFSEAAEHFANAIDYLWDSGDTQSIVYTLANMSMNYADMGDYAMARDAAHMALMRAEVGMDGSQMSTAYSRLASLYRRMGEYRVAVDFARLAQQYDRQTDREWRAFTMMALEGEALLGLGLFDEAVDTLQKTLDFFRINGPEQRVFTTQLRLIRAYLDKNDLESASRTLREAMSFRQQQDSLALSSENTTILLLRAEILLAQGNAAEAVAILELIDDTLDDYISPRHVEVASLLMEAYSELGRTERAIASGYQAIDYIATIRRQLEFSRLGPAWSDETYSVYLNLMHNLLRAAGETGNQEFQTRALQVAEQGLANNLAQQLLSARNGNNVETAETQRLRRQLTNLARQRAASVGTDTYSDSTLEYFKVRELYQASLDLDPVAPDLEVPSIADVQSRLGNDDVILEFACVPGAQCYGFAITRDDFDVKALGYYADIEALAQEIQLAARNSRGNPVEAAVKLGELLMADLLPSGRNNLFIIANYPLGTIPLAILGSGSVDRYEPLVENYSLTRLPSLTTFYHLQEPPERDYQYELAVLADPEFGVSDTRQLISSPAEGAVDVLRGWYDELERLPWSAREAENLKEIFSDLPVRTMTGAQASKSNLLDEATRNSRIVHIASHGYFNVDTPDLVGIATSPRSDEAGFVTLDDLILYPFNAELVVISGCETGLGQERGGEGLMSLSRGFLGQGVDQVISTLWPVSDRASAEFMRLFYSALQGEGLAPADALRTAQNQLARNPQYRAPFYWASYVLTSMSL